MDNSKKKLNKLSIQLDARAVEGLHRYLISTIDNYDPTDPYIEDIYKLIVTLNNIKESYE